MEISEDEIPSLRGWFIKEKRDKYKRQSFLSGAGSNRRWFTIERIPVNGGPEEASRGLSGGRGGPDKLQSFEMALCYYKRSSANEQRGGWMFLNDVLSLNQDVVNRWITIEHPTRTLRLQSPTPAQHRVWFSTLTKCCKSARKELESATVSPMSNNKQPSLPFFSGGKTLSNTSKRVGKIEALASTPKDELKFLRELTGRVNEEPDEKVENATKVLFHTPSSRDSQGNGKESNFHEGDVGPEGEAGSDAEKEFNSLMHSKSTVNNTKSDTNNAGINGVEKTTSSVTSAKVWETATSNNSRSESLVELKPCSKQFVQSAEGTLKSDDKKEFEINDCLVRGVQRKEEDCDEVCSFHDDPDSPIDGKSGDIITSITQRTPMARDGAAFSVKCLEKATVTKEINQPRAHEESGIRAYLLSRKNGECDALQWVSTSSSESEGNDGCDSLADAIPFEIRNRHRHEAGGSSFHSNVSSLTRNDSSISNTNFADERKKSSEKELSKSYSFSSSVYQLHFDNDGDEFQPDDNFVNEDWDVNND